MPFPELPDPQTRDGALITVYDVISVAQFLDDEIDDSQLRKLIDAADIVIKAMDFALDSIGVDPGDVSNQQVITLLMAALKMRDNVDNLSNELDS